MMLLKELLDDLLKGVERPEDLRGDAGLMKELKIRLMERMPGAGLTAHPGYGGCAFRTEQPPGRHRAQGAEGAGW